MTLKTMQLMEKQIKRLNKVSEQLSITQLECDKIWMELRHLTGVALKENELMEKGEKGG